MTPFRGCLIGAGFFARNHMNAWAGLEDAEIVAVCDLDRARAQDMADAFGVSAVYTDAAAMLAEAAPDFVDIATTPPSHRALVELAAPLTRLVICQKPIADTLGDARAMVAAAGAAGSTLIVHENFRWQAGFVRLHALLRDGAIGTPRHARFSFRNRYDVYAGQPYLATVERFAIMDVGIHLYDLARHFMGEVAALSCVTQRRNPDVRGEDAFTSLLSHEGGGVSVVDASFHSLQSPEPFPQTLARIEGDEGTLDLREDYRLIRHDRAGRHEEDLDPPVPAWGERPWHAVQDSVIAFQAHVLRVLAGQEDAQPSGRDNLSTLELALASYDAAASGARLSMVDWQKAQR